MSTTNVGGTSPAAYEPRQSTVVSTNANDALLHGDGDTWEEKLAVCETSTADGNPKLLIRSYFRNIRTHDRVWDEPPSGASKIEHATAEMRRKAQTQLAELQVTLEMIPDDSDFETSNENNISNQSETRTENSRKGIFSRFMRNRNSKPKVTKAVDVSKDLNLQKAIARSLIDQGGVLLPSPPAAMSRLGSDDAIFGENDDPDLALAMALSLSECNDAGSTMAKAVTNDVDDHDEFGFSHNNNLTDEVMMRSAATASQQDLKETRLKSVEDE